MTFMPEGGGTPPEQQASPVGTTPPGWYGDPQSADVVRWWDGLQWTDHTQPVTPTHAGPSYQGAQPAYVGEGSTVPLPGEPAAFDLPTEQPRKRRNVAAAAGTIGGLVGVIVVKLALSGALGSLINTLTDDSDGQDSDSRRLTAVADAGWTTLSILEGEGSVAFDPAWESAEELVDAESIAASMSENSGLDVHLDGVWTVESDADGNSSVLYVYSVNDLPGLALPQTEVEAWIEAPYDGETNTQTVTEGPVVTQAGIHGYVAEFAYDLYGWPYTDSVGVIVEDKAEVIVYLASGSESLGSGVDVVETVLNSLTITG